MIWSTLSKPESCYVDGCLCVWLGLIIDAFGELRDQLEQVKEDMEVSILRPTPLPNFTSHPPPQFYTTPRQFYTTPPSPILYHTPSPILHHTPLPNFTPHPLPNFTSYPLPNFTSHPLPNFTPHPPPQFYTTSLRNFTSHPPPQFYTPFPNFTIPPPQYYTTPPPQFYITPPSPYNSTPPCAITLLLLFSFPVQQLLSRWKHLSTCFIFYYWLVSVLFLGRNLLILICKLLIICRTKTVGAKNSLIWFCMWISVASEGMEVILMVIETVSVVCEFLVQVLFIVSVFSEKKPICASPHLKSFPWHHWFLTL